MHSLVNSNANCRNLREMFKIDAADYMMSICGNDALRELSSPGKSGSVFFLSQDDRFMIKTLRKSEVKVCLSLSELGPFMFVLIVVNFFMDAESQLSQHMCMRFENLSL